MIVLLGTAEKEIKKGKVNLISCPNCKVSSKFEYKVFVNYTVLTFLPLFPVKKRPEIQCLNCKTTINHNELTENDLINL